MSALNAPYTPSKWLLFIRIAQTLSIHVVLGLTAYVFTNITNGNAEVGNEVSQMAPGLPFAFFSYAWTFAYLLFAKYAAHRVKPSAKPILIVLVFECLTVIFWLVTFALLADESNKAAQYLAYVEDNTYLYVSSAVTTPLQCLEASAGIAALVFVLFIVSLVAVSLLTHQNMGNTSAASSQQAAANEGGHNKEVQPSVLEVQPNTA